MGTQVVDVLYVIRSGIPKATEIIKIALTKNRN